MIWLTLMACSGSDDGETTDTPTDVVDETAHTGTETDTPPEHTGETTTPIEFCEIDAGLSVTGLTTSDGPHSTLRAVHVELSKPATVAVRCKLDGDPTEVHLLESTTEATSHDLRFSGLLPNATYTCEATPTCPTIAGAPSSISVTTGPRPNLLPDVTVTVDPTLGMTGSWTMMNWRDGACPQDGNPWLVVYDEEGTLRWWKQFPVELTGDIEGLWHAEDDAIVWGGGYSAEGRCRVSPLWEETDAYACENLPNALSIFFHHDAKRLADGRMLTLEARANNRGPVVWSGFGVRVHDPASGRVDVDINSQRYADEGSLPDGSAADPEPYHANAVELYQVPGGPERLYVSLCFDRSIMAIDPTNGDLRWRLVQGEGWTVWDAQGNRLSEDMLPQCQHGMDILGDDRILVYDNGQFRESSQITDLSIDGVNKRVTVNWQWTDGWYEDTLGDVDDLGNGRVLVDQAHPKCWSRAPAGAKTKVLEIDQATGQVASMLEMPTDRDASYRAQRYDGCELFPGTRFCDATRTRLAQLRPLFER
ncbi:MAG: hypothetical protein KC621_03275 [Myxococcales bacterium]|nr:hypothetical protein [Myxococcales bacterium]